MSKSKILTYTILFLIILLTVDISLWTLYPQSIRLDEAQSIWYYTKSVPAFLKLTAEDVHVPLYGFILHFWLQIWGNSIIAARTLSLIFFVLTVPMLFKLIKEVSNKRVALFTAFLFSLSPFIVWYSNEARMYTLFLLATTINHYYFLKVYNSDGRTGKFGLFLSMVMGLYSHYFFIFLLITQALFVISKLFGFIRTDVDFNHPPAVSQFTRYKAFAVQYFKQLMFAGLLLIPWLLYVASLGYASNSSPLIPRPTTFNIFQTFANFLFGFQTQTIQGLLISLWPLLVLFILFVFTNRKRIDTMHFEYFVMVTFLPVFFAFVASYIHPLFLSRYLIFVTPTLFFIIAAVIMSYPKKTANIIITTVVFFSVLLLLNQNVSASTPVKENYRGVADYLNSHAKPEDVIAISTPFTIYPVEYYYTGQTRIETIPQWDRYVQGPIPVFSIAELKKQIDTDKEKYASIFVVLSYDQGYENQIKKYMDEHYQLEKVSKFSQGLQIREYKLRYDIK